MTSVPATPAACGVVVPAMDEEREILGCLDSIASACRDALERYPEMLVRVVCVADSCRDGTARLVREHSRAHPEVSLLEVDHASVGASRATGCQRLIDEFAALGAHDPASVWLATTDADTRVPAHWLTTHLDWAAEGVDCAVGTVEPRNEDGSHRALRPADVIDQWHALHRLGDGHDYVFGANLGIRAATYLDVGGFRPVRSGEDVALVRAAREAGAAVVRSDAARVRTSARRSMRVEDGFGTFLDALSPSATLDPGHPGRVGDLSGPTP